MTPRNPERETIASEVVGVMRLLGWEPMPWQWDLLQTAFEIDPETGCLWYSEIVVVIPRQSGKSTVIIPWGVHRMVMWPQRQFLLYIAQTRDKALEKLQEEHFFHIEKSPFRKLLIPNRRGALLHLSHGAEHMKWRGGSKWAIDAPTEDAGHGGTLGLTIGDEIFAQKDDRLEDALAPTTATIDDAQSLWISTAGNSKLKSPFLWRKVEAGRARVEAVRADPSFLRVHRSMYIEYSAPIDADPLDPMTWWGCMPALGYTQTVRKIAGFADSMKERFYRPFLNWWSDELGAEWEIPQAKWSEALDPKSQIDDVVTDHLVWVVDISPDRDWASIGVAGQRSDGKLHIEVVSDGPGTAWLIEGQGEGDERLKGIRELVERNGGKVYYEHKTTGTLAPDLAEAGIDAEPIGAQDIAVAAPGLKDYVLNGRVVHIGQTELSEALTAAVKSVMGDGWKWARGRSLQPITSLVSVTYALRMLAKTLPDLGYDPVAVFRAANLPAKERTGG